MYPKKQIKFLAYNLHAQMGEIEPQLTEYINNGWSIIASGGGGAGYSNGYGLPGMPPQRFGDHLTEIAVWFVLQK